MLFDRGDKSTKELLSAFDNWADEFLWSTDSMFLYLNSEETGESHIQVTDLNGRVQPFFALGSLSEMRVLAGGQALLCMWNTVYRPSEAILLSVPGTEMLHKLERKANALGADKLGSNGPIGAVQFKQITNLNGRLMASIEASSEQSFWFQGAEDAKVEGFIVKPPTFDPKKKYPVKF